jgi:hypothetical protein
LAACSGGGGGAKKPSGPATTAISASSESTTTMAPVSHSINHAVYYAGFSLNLGEATLHSTDTGGRVVDIVTAFGNEGSDPTAFSATLDLASAGSHYQPDDRSAKLPTVAGQAQSSGNLSFDVDDKFTFADAILTIGQASHEQVVLPLGAGGTLVDLAPKTFALTGTASTGPLKLDVKGGLLRTDNPKDHLEAEKGKRFLSISFDVTDTTGVPGGYAFTHDNVALKLSDGTQLVPDDGPIELLNPNSTLRAQTVRFTVPAPGAGSYQLVLIDDTAAPHTTSAIALTVPA